MGDGFFDQVGDGGLKWREVKEKGERKKEKGKRKMLVLRAFNRILNIE